MKHENGKWISKFSRFSNMQGGDIKGNVRPILVDAKQKHQNRKKGILGFTLVEMMIVLIIIAVLVGTGVLAITSAISTADSNRDQLNLDQANLGIVQHQLSTSSYPTLQQLASSFIHNPPAPSIDGTKGKLAFSGGTSTVYCYTGTDCTGDPASTTSGEIQSCCLT